MTSVAVSSPEIAEERAGAVVWIAVGLLVLTLLVLGVAFGLVKREDSFDPSSLFLDGVPPTPWNLASSEQHASGTWIVRLERGGDTAADEPEEIVLLVPKSHSSVKRWVEGWLGEDRHDRHWGGGPADDDTLERWREDPSEVEPFTRALEREPVAWGGWEAPASRVRTFESDGSWTESVRVDLSQPPERHLVLVARWPDEVVADPKRVRPLLAGVRMLPEDE